MRDELARRYARVLRRQEERGVSPSTTSELSALEVAMDAEAHLEYAPGEPAEADAELVFEKAIADGRVVAFKYRDAEGVPSYRVVSPYELRNTLDLHVGVVVVAYDHGREGVRQFRLDRIEGSPWYVEAEDYVAPAE